MCIVLQCVGLAYVYTRSRVRTSTRAPTMRVRVSVCACVYVCLCQPLPCCMHGLFAVLSSTGSTSLMALSTNTALTHTQTRMRRHQDWWMKA